VSLDFIIMYKQVSLTDSNFRYLSVVKRDSYIRQRDNLLAREEPSLDRLASFTENVIGRFSLGQSLVLDAVINSKTYHLPLVTEEPSVIAALNKAVKLFNRCGVSSSHDLQHVLAGQVHFCLTGVSFDEVSSYLKNNEMAIKTQCINSVPKLSRLIARGGGFSGPFTVLKLENSDYCKLEFNLDVQESMGANTVNLVAEYIASMLKQTFQNSIRIIFSILSNDCSNRKSYASVSIPLNSCDTIPSSVAKQIQEASTIAFLDKQRAITHNKGIMNGVSALALATGQDTRAIEAAVHFYAQNLGHDQHYGPLSSWTIKDNVLFGKIALPTPVSVVGRLKDNHDHVNDNLVELMQNPTSFELGHCLAYVGLASNFSALLALVTDGISKGHMALHDCGVS